MKESDVGMRKKKENNFNPSLFHFPAIIFQV